MVEKAKYLAFEQNGQEYNLYDLPDGFVFEDDLDLLDYLSDDPDLSSNLDLSSEKLTELPDLFHVIIRGNFDCSYNDLTSLKGCPQKVGGKFDCRNNKLFDLAGMPREIKGEFLYDQLNTRRIIDI